MMPCKNILQNSAEKSFSDAKIKLTKIYQVILLVKNQSKSLLKNKQIYLQVTKVNLRRHFGKTFNKNLFFTRQNNFVDNIWNYAAYFWKNLFVVRKETADVC